MSRAHHRLLLWSAATDDTFTVPRRSGEPWVGKCLHCKRRVRVLASGKPDVNTTLEHIVPRTQGGENVLRNLGVACGRCNGQKGVRVDRLGPGHPRYDQMVAYLTRVRRERWRDPPEWMDAPPEELLGQWDDAPPDEG